MRLQYSLLLLLLGTACHQSIPRSETPANAASEPVTAASSNGGADSPTATVIDTNALQNTTEDPSYAAPGEDLAKGVESDLVGKPAPVATMKTIDGETIDLGKLYGKKPIYIKFWATWCVPCRQQMPAFEKVFETQGDKMQMIAVDTGFSDDEASVRAFRAKYGIKMPVVIDDGRLGALFHLRVTPQHVLIGADGRFAHIGHADDKRLAVALQAVLSGKASSPAPAGKALPAEHMFKPGDVITGLSARTMTGKAISLGATGTSHLRGVVFFSSWCEWYLKTSRPATSKACARVREDVDKLAVRYKDVDWIGISGGPWSTAKDLADYQATNKRKIPLALDASGTLFRSFGVRDIPTIALIDPAGKLVRFVGPGETDIAGAVLAVRAGTSSNRSVR